MKFHGEFEELKDTVQSLGFTINYFGPKGNCHHIKTQEGAILAWYESTGTLQFQGKQEPKELLEVALEKALKARAEVSLENVKINTDNFAPKSPELEDMQNRKVFVVHGHDSMAREQLELILHKLGADPFVLQNTGGGGLTIIEALESEIGSHNNAARFGIVLLTPDDMGYAKTAGESEAQPRARQNVVLEMGMLIAALGRSNVAILKKGHIEVPSDAQGILYLSFNEHVKEVVPKLVDRLNSAGFNLQANKITHASS